MLDELPRPHPALELLAREEVVVDAISLARTGRTRGGGDRQLQLGQSLHQSPDESPLADARGASDNEYARHGQDPRDGSGGT
jgi:hypothetical protein